MILYIFREQIHNFENLKNIHEILSEKLIILLIPKIYLFINARGIEEVQIWFVPKFIFY